MARREVKENFRPVHSHLRATFRTVSGKREGKLSERTDFSEDWLAPAGPGEAARILRQDEKARFFAFFPPRRKKRAGKAKKIAERERMDVSSSFPLFCSSSFRSFLMKNRPFEKRGWKKNAAMAVEEEDRGWQAGGVRYQCIQEKEFPLKTGENAEKRWNQRAEEEETPRGLRIERG